MTTPKDKGSPWSDEELRSAVDAYLYMLQLEQGNIPFSPSAHSEILLTGPLYRRNDAAVRYRMRNISFVLREQKIPILTAFSPAPQVGKNVRMRLERILQDRSKVLDTIVTKATAKDVEVQLSDVIESLDSLQEKISELANKRKIGIGHNNPPEQIDVEEDDIEKTSELVGELKAEVVRPQRDRTRIDKIADALSKFGLKITVWCGQRFTDFAQAGAVAAGTSWGLAASGVGEQILEALRALFKFLG